MLGGSITVTNPADVRTPVTLRQQSHWEQAIIWCVIWPTAPGYARDRDHERVKSHATS